MSASSELMQTLAWSLLHFLWQGAAIAAVAAALMFVYRRPGTRYLVGIAALVVMLASFGATFAYLNGASAAVDDMSAARAPAAALAFSAEASAHSSTQFGEPQTSPASGFDFLWIARGWLAGVFVFALRIAFGLLLIEHLRRRNLIALPAELVARFRALFNRSPSLIQLRNHDPRTVQLGDFFSHSMRKTAEQFAFRLGPEIDLDSLMWTFQSLDEDKELEQFFEGLPGLCDSKTKCP